MKVLVVPEDPTYDQYILKPIVERLFQDLDKTARVEVLQKPRLRGVEQALDPEVLADVVATYRMFDVFLLLVDRDGNTGRHDRVAQLEGSLDRLVACLAIEEVEVWMLALHREKLTVGWQAVRAEPHAKETFAAPFLAEHAPKLGPGEGRKWAMRELGAGWSGLLRVCPELEDLRQRLRQRLEADGAPA